MLAIGRWGSGEADKEKMMTDIVDDQIDVVGRAFLGLTVACARCHDHKFDPITNADYYALAGIFFSSRIVPDPGAKTGDTLRLRLPLASPAEVERRKAHAARVAEVEKLLKAQPNDPELSVALKALKDEAPPPLPTAHGILDGGVPGTMYAGLHDARIHVRGSYTRLGDVVPRRFPVILAGDQQTPITQGSGRLELARWITEAEEPADGARHGQSSLAASFRRRPRAARRATSASSAIGRRIPNCSIIWPISSSNPAGRSRPCTGR